jgi:hypothetical protein
VRRPFNAAAVKCGRIATRAVGDRHISSRILWAISTAFCVVCKCLKTQRRGFVDRTSPSASLASRDILFPALGIGRNPADRGHLRSFIRTTVTRSEAHFGPFPVSLWPLSLTQPNHAHFGTVTGTSTDQWVRGSAEALKERSLEEPPSGEGNTARTVRYGRTFKFGRLQ